jgi:anti-anti-sigma regulatory factor
MTTIVLPPRCDRAAAEALLPEFVAALGSKAIAVDGSAVSHAGQAILQVLASARASAAGAVITPSAALLDAAQLAGLSYDLFEESRA